MPSPSLAVTDVEQVKAIGAIDQNSTASDAYLTSLIAEVGRVFEGWLGPLLQTTRTEDHDVSAFDTTVWLRSYPVSSITSVHNRSSFSVAWADASEIASTEYAFNSLGRLRVQTRLNAGMDALRVVYTGGWATTTANFQANYADLASAAARQVVHAFRRRKDPDGATITEGGLTHTTKELQLLHSVREVLTTHSRTVL